MTTVAAPPSAGPPPQMSPGGRTATRAALVIAATVVLIGAVVGLAGAAWTVSSFRVSADAEDLPAGMRSLTVDTGHIPVAVRITSDREAHVPRVDLRLVNASRSGDHGLTVTTETDSTRIALDDDASTVLDWARGGEITVTLPPEQARRLSLTAQQSIGVLSVQTDLDQLVARTTDADVVLSGAARRIEIDTISGDVHSRGPISVTEQFSAHTADGDVRVDFGDAAPRTVDTGTRDGDIAIGLPTPGPYLVRAQSGGSIRVRVPETTSPDTAVTSITARSDNGDIVLDDVGFRQR